MKFISKLIPVLALSGVAVATQAAEGPNVIIVFIDDFGYGEFRLLREYEASYSPYRPDG